MNMQKELEKNGYTRYEATIRKINNKQVRIKFPEGIGNVGDVVEVYVKKIKELKEVS